MDPEQDRLRARIIARAKEYGRYGYRTVTDLLRSAGWTGGYDRVYTSWRQEGLQVPQQPPKRARLWRADGSGVRLRPTHRNHVWSYDFVADRTHDGRSVRILNVLDEYTRECLASVVAQRIRSQAVILVLAELFLHHGVPQPLRSDNGPEFIAKKRRRWLKPIAVEPLSMEPGAPGENGSVESFNGKMRDQFLNGELFSPLKEAQILTERWRIHSKTIRPHRSLGGQPPAPEVLQLAS